MSEEQNEIKIEGLITHYYGYESRQYSRTEVCVVVKHDKMDDKMIVADACESIDLRADVDINAVVQKLFETVKATAEKYNANYNKLIDTLKSTGIQDVYVYHEYDERAD